MKVCIFFQDLSSVFLFPWALGSLSMEEVLTPLLIFSVGFSAAVAYPES